MPRLATTSLIAALLLPACAAHRHAIRDVETRRWRQGEPPVRIMSEQDGFCALTMVTGRFEGGGEIVRCWVDDDGWWRLGGNSCQQDVAAECVVVRWR